MGSSLLVEQTDTIKSTTIFDYFRADERAGGLHLYRQQPGVLGAIFGSPALGDFLDSQIANYRTIQKRNFYGAFDDGINGGQAYRKQIGISNDTSIPFGNITVRDRKSTSEEHTSELPSLMRNSYVVFCLKKKNT